MTVNRLITVFFLLVTQFALPQQVKRLPQVTIAPGIISGMANYNGTINIFKGVPFAAPPVGINRWRAPQPVKPWQGVKACDKFGASPMQPTPRPFSVYTQEYLIPTAPISEDCLYLNIWAPAKTNGKKLPVLVWIPGGGFVSGGGAVPVYDGERTANKGIVFVTINYRVGVFGFFAHPQLSGQEDRGKLANYGLMDQLAALQWVQQNIEGFGGDKNNVTVAGQSAGGTSIICLLASPLAKGLFAKAIVQSGAGLLPSSPRNTSLQQMEANGEAIFKQLGVKSVQEARELPAEKLLQANGRFGPVVEGYLLPDNPTNILSAGKQHRVPVLVGSNYHENKPDSSGATISSQRYALNAYLLAKMHSGVAPVYLYQFTLRMGADAMNEYTTSFHSAEIPYVYNNLRFSKRKYLLGDEMTSLEMNRYWTKFMRDSDPNQPEMNKWLPYTNAKKWIMNLGDWPGRRELEAPMLDELYEELKERAAR